MYKSNLKSIDNKLYSIRLTLCISTIQAVALFSTGARFMLYLDTDMVGMLLKALTCFIRNLA